MITKKIKVTKITAFLLSLVLSMGILLNIPVLLLIAQANNNTSGSGPQMTAEAAIVIDFKTGEVLYERDADRMIAPASMTKMMTLYIVYEAIADGRLNFDTRLTPSQRAVDLSRDAFNTNIRLSRDIQYTVYELIDAAVSVSAAGATLMLVEAIAGSSENFLEIMNAKVAEWGIDAIFFSTIGGTTHTRMTARAMSVITRNFIMRFPEILDMTAKRNITFAGPNNVHPTTNDLLGQYEGLDGFKTGTSMESMENFAGTAERDGVRLISVVMRSQFGGNRFTDTAALLDYGFNAVTSTSETALVLPDYYMDIANLIAQNFVIDTGSWEPEPEPELIFITTVQPIDYVASDHVGTEADDDDVFADAEFMDGDGVGNTDNSRSPRDNTDSDDSDELSLAAIIAILCAAQLVIGAVWFSIVKKR